MSLADALAAEQRSTGNLGKLADLLTRSGIDPDEIDRVENVRISTWQGLTKDADGTAHVHELEGASLVVTPAWASGPAWPVIQPGPVVKLPPRKAAVGKAAVWQRAVVLPDMQIGYWRDPAGELRPIHDEGALAIALEIVRAARPDRVVMVGDNLDFPELSMKFRRTPSFQRCTQATVDRATVLAAQVRDAAPDAEIDWLAGNHEERLPNWIIDNAVAAYGLRRGRADETADRWPVLSVPFLCRLDEYGVVYHPGYPANEVWLNDRLRVIHGEHTTAEKYLNEERVSTLFGHVHRRVWSERTRHTRHGPNTILAASPGCLCRIDGSVPSSKQGVDLDGQPIVSWENWQQGVAVVDFEPGQGRFTYDPVSIFSGWARWHGREFSAHLPDPPGASSR